MAAVVVAPTSYTMETFSGARINPLDPEASAIHIADIAHALSNICRFTGHVREFYSVGQHSVLVALALPPKLRLAGLLHDASEAYLSDIARPVKHQPLIHAVYEPAESRLMEMIARKYGFEWPLPPAVKAADNLLCNAEGRDLMPGTMDWWKRDGEPLHPPIEPWLPARAERAFCQVYDRILTGGRIRHGDLV